MTAGGTAGTQLDVLVIGGGQAGLAMGHQLTRLGLRFQIVAQATIATTSAATSLRRPLGSDGVSPDSRRASSTSSWVGARRWSAKHTADG